MKSIKKLARKLAEQLPFALTKNLAYDRQTLQVMRKVLRLNSNCVDVGCHKGEVLEHMLRFAPEGQHFGFEPIPSFFNDLEKNFPSNCTFYNVALSDSEGEVTFNYVVSNPAYSGIKKRSYAKENEIIEKIKVETKRLDQLLSGVKIDFIKIDVEGAELGVLKGAENLIRHQKPVIVFEHGLGAADHYGTKPEHVYDLLTQFGLKLNTMKGWLNQTSAFTREAFCQSFNSASDYYFIAFP